MRPVVRVVWLALLIGTAGADESVEPVTEHDWREVVVSVTDIDRTAAFFLEIGDYELKWRGAIDAGEIASWDLPAGASGEAMLIGPADYDTGFIRLVRFENAGRREPMRPGARTWDSGCYFSLMIRMKDMQAVYDDAIRLGWWTETPITFLEFGTSKLNVVIYRGPDGVQVQGYERLEPPLPATIPEFARFTGPFNVMQMVRSRDAAYAYFTEVLGFATFYNGKPYVAEKPEPTPLGIPVNLTTEVSYAAGIVYPTAGEFGRMEMIEVNGLEGNDYADRCSAPNLGILAVRFPVDDVKGAVKTIRARGGTIERGIHNAAVAPYGNLSLFQTRTPDGAIVQFFEGESR